MNRIQELEKLILQHDHSYWINDEPTISDIDYDKLTNELRSLNPNSYVLSKINDKCIKSTLGKIQHAVLMLSLDKVYSDVDLFKWLDKTSRNATHNNGDEIYSLQPKLDGLSADKNFDTLATRGDGTYGEDISNKIPIITVESLDYNGPMKDDPTPSRRGEIIVKKDTYVKYKEVILKGDGTPYKTPRGMASGLVNQDDVDLSLTAVLTFVEFSKFGISYTDSMLRELDWFSMLSKLKVWEYPTDGLVIKLVDKVYSDSLGFTSHHPRGQMAYKAANPSAKSILRQVIWQSGKGRLTPVGVIDPVVIAGATIRRVSLSNAKNIIDRDININDELTIERAGEIIPYVVNVTKCDGRIPIRIDICPDCSTNVIYDDPNVKCPNPNCSGMLAKQLTDSVARLGFEYLAGATVQKLLDIGIENLTDILTVTLNDIFQLDGFAETSSHKLFNEIQRIRTEPLDDWKLLSSLNIKGIGKRVSRKILADLSFEELKTADIDRLVLIDTIGVERAIEISEYFEKNIMFINELEALVNMIAGDITPTKLICFTGKVDKKRAELEKMAEDKGFTVTNSVTNELSILVTNNVHGTGGKMTKAKGKPTIQIITYDEFYVL